MNKMTRVYLTTCEAFEKTFVHYLERPLLLEEKNSLRNAGSFQMLESFSRGIDSIKNKKDAERELKELLKLKRLNDYIDFFLEKMTEKKVVIQQSFKKKMEAKGNILDLIIFWDELEENNLSQTEISQKEEHFLASLDQRR